MFSQRRDLHAISLEITCFQGTCRINRWSSVRFYHLFHPKYVFVRERDFQFCSVTWKINLLYMRKSSKQLTANYVIKIYNFHDTDTLNMLCDTIFGNDDSLENLYSQWRGNIIKCRAPRCTFETWAKCDMDRLIYFISGNTKRAVVGATCHCIEFSNEETCRWWWFDITVREERRSANALAQEGRCTKENE